MEKLAEALYALNPDRQSWNGDSFGFEEACRRGEHQAKLALRQAEMLVKLGVIDELATELIPSMWELQRAHGVK